eukprot:2272536-Amphidinium_carterae.1
MSTTTLPWPGRCRSGRDQKVVSSWANVGQDLDFTWISVCGRTWEGLDVNNCAHAPSKTNQ